MRLNILLILFCFSACLQHKKYPAGGYAYPEFVSGIDTDFYYYAVKDHLPVLDSCNIAYQKYNFHAFNEPNLSLRPLNKEVFRLTYMDVFGDCLFINIYRDSLVIKKGISVFPLDIDSTKLTAKENEHLTFLNRNVSVLTSSKPPNFNKKTDSMVRLYPELSDIKYYYGLLTKAFKKIPESFSYKQKTIPFSPGQYDSLVAQIDSSGFWEKPYSKYTNGCDDSVDGYDATIEANTAKRYQVVCIDRCSASDHLLEKIATKFFKYRKVFE